MANYIEAADVISTWLAGVDTSPLTGAGVNITTLLNAMMPDVNAEVERRAGQSLLEATRTVRIDGTNLDRVQLPNFPIKSLASLKVYAGWETLLKEFVGIRHSRSELLDMNGDAPSSGCDVYVERDSGIAIVNASEEALFTGAAADLWAGDFRGGRLNVLATYTSGFATVPDDVKAAAGKIAAMRVAKMCQSRATGGARSVSIGSVSKSFGPAEADPLLAAWEKEITAALSRFRIGYEAVGGG